MRVSSYFTIVIISLTMVACGGSKSVDDEVVVESLGEGEGEGVGGVAGAGLDSGDISSSKLDGSKLDGDSTVGQNGVASIDGNLLNRRVIYFDYDSSLLTQENEAIVRAHAQYLQTLPGTQIVLEGHTDERGTREYNLALGENRAQAVSRIMQALGLDSNRIQTISYGEERPASSDSTANSWNLNRRVEILYP